LQHVVDSTFSRLLRRRDLHQQLDQAVLEVVGERHHLGHHLAGQVVEVLRHHDVGQVAVDAPVRASTSPTKFITAPEATALHRVGDDRRAMRAVSADDACSVPWPVDRVQHLVGGVGGLVGDVGQAAARVGQAVGRGPAAWASRRAAASCRAAGG
jgi:hypothetical protein